MKILFNKISFYAMRSIKNKKIKNFFINKKVKAIGNKSVFNGVGKSIEIKKDELSLSGCTNLGLFLSTEEVDLIIEKTKDFKCYDPFRKDLGFFKAEMIPNKVHVANYQRKDLVSIKEILDIANNSDILKYVQEFLGATPTISNINMWWSISGKEKAEQAQMFHRDVDDFKFCKLFIYLTNVELENGPHVYVEGSSISNKLLKIRRHQDEEVISAFGENKIKFFTGKKGSTFLADTFGFHKGLLPQKGKRLLLQVQYSLNPIGIEKYEPISISNNPYDSYVNRLILQ